MLLVGPVSRWIIMFTDWKSKLIEHYWNRIHIRSKKKLPQPGRTNSMKCFRVIPERCASTHFLWSCWNVSSAMLSSLGTLTSFCELFFFAASSGRAVDLFVMSLRALRLLSPVIPFLRASGLPLFDLPDIQPSTNN